MQQQLVEQQPTKALASVIRRVRSGLLDGSNAGTTDLLSPEECKQVIAEAEERLKPAGIELGITAAERLFAAFPYDTRKDPKVFVEAVSAAFASCPALAVEKVISELVLKHSFLPTAADVKKTYAALCEPIEEARNYASAHLFELERKKRKQDAEQDKLEASKQHGREVAESMSLEEKLELLRFMPPGMRAAAEAELSKQPHGQA